jgi:hypothetical protein
VPLANVNSANNCSMCKKCILAAYLSPLLCAIPHCPPVIRRSTKAIEIWVSCWRPVADWPGIGNGLAGADSGGARVQRHSSDVESCRVRQNCHLGIKLLGLFPRGRLICSGACSQLRTNSDVGGFLTTVKSLRSFAV